MYPLRDPHDCEDHQNDGDRRTGHFIGKYNSIILNSHFDKAFGRRAGVVAKTSEKAAILNLCCDDNDTRFARSSLIENLTRRVLKAANTMLKVLTVYGK